MYARSILNLGSISHLVTCICLAVVPASLNAQTSSIQLSDEQPTVLYSSQPVFSSPDQARVITPTTPIVKTSHQFSLNSNGILEGRITTGYGSPSGLSVYLVADKKIIGEGTTSSTGVFSIAGIDPGNYSLFVAGNQKFAAQGISVTRQSGINNPLELTTVTTQYQGLKELIGNTVIPTIVQASRRSTSNISVITTESETIDKVRIVNGSIRGQISSLISEKNASGVQVHLIQNGQSISQVETNSLGSFTIPDVEPGVYDFVAVGKLGFAAIQIQAIGNRSPMRKISYRAEGAIALQVSLAEDVVSVQENGSDSVQYFPGNDVLMEPAVNSRNASMQYAGESIAFGIADGGTAGSIGNFTNFSRGGGVAGRFGGRFGSRFRGGLRGGRLASGSTLGRLLTLGAIGGGVVAIADENPAPASPTN